MCTPVQRMSRRTGKFVVEGSHYAFIQTTPYGIRPDKKRREVAEEGDVPGFMHQEMRSDASLKQKPQNSTKTRREK